MFIVFKIDLCEHMLDFGKKSAATVHSNLSQYAACLLNILKAEYIWLNAK